MANLTTRQIAELLVGISRTHQAIIDALENSKAGFKSTHFRPALESTSRIRSNRPETLVDLPSRLLLQMLGRNPPDSAQIAQEIEALLSQERAPAADSGTARGPALPDITAEPVTDTPAAVAPDPDAIPFDPGKP